MVDLSTQYLGMKLKNPVIAGSSGLTNSVKSIQDLEESGAGAVVLKSIFEEEIAFEYEDILKEASEEGVNLDQFDYYDFHIKGEKLDKYTTLIEESKKSVSIPVIASINCVYSHEWTSFAKQLQTAGADALELNMFFLPSEFDRTTEEKEKAYFQIIEKVQKEITIPIALKISYYFSNLGPMIQKLSETGIAGLVLFNRFYSPDIDIDKMEVVSSNVFSTPSDLPISLRWIAIMAERVNCDLAASTGVHDGTALIKQILAGANAVQVASTLYKNGKGQITEMLKTLETWMDQKNYGSLTDFRGKMSQAKSSDPAAYERVQFMRYFGGKK
ncbi:Putative dihydropyrimidine dehydrogenase [NADP+], similar to dihydroorotate dehydrogenase [Olavius algarvensis Delta 1 endosymbiont]|nr:Putative dihydropyrimidine dehydrogenase [NADP+], similar to dihydroorotate dehydrogenase [Olavius algarvensis Delta 1 endosymbiont]